MQSSKYGDGTQILKRFPERGTEKFSERKAWKEEKARKLKKTNWLLGGIFDFG